MSDRSIDFLWEQHRLWCYENAEHPEEYNTPYSDAAEALERADVAAPKVKPLEWAGEGYPWVQTIVGLRYLIRPDSDGGWCWILAGETSSVEPFTSMEEAKAAAQADYERRILSALEGE